MARTRLGSVGLRAPEPPFFDAARGFLLIALWEVFAFFMANDFPGLNAANYSTGEDAKKSASLPNALAR